MSEKEQRPNDFALFRMLCELENVIRQYPDETDALEEIRQLSGQIESKRYRVAVIGEFRRGKSSMLNALLGASVLPTDILPMTATVNRIVYGSEKEVLIRYRDGRTQRAEISALADYVTKLTEQNVRVAGEIREVTVSYPSVFLKNHIELYDTPGLNDDDPMTKITLDVLPEIDAAIVVISAVMPFSMTERNLILKLLEYPEIRNIIFVVTFIDQVSSRKKDQDRVVNYIQKRITEETMQLVRSTHGEDEALLAKAQRILETPKVFAISSMLALKGFLYDDEELLTESRFPEFKYALTEILTASQDMDIFYKVSDFIKKTEKNIDVRQKEQLQKAESHIGKAEICFQKCQEYTETSHNRLQQLLWETDKKLTQLGIDTAYGRRSGTVIDVLRRFFINALSSLRRDTFSAEAVRLAVAQAAELALQRMDQLRQTILQTLVLCQKTYEETRDAEYTTIIEYIWDTAVPRDELDALSIEFPAFRWNGPLYPPQTDLLRADIIALINERLLAANRDYQLAAERSLADFRKALLSQNRSDRAFFETIRAQWEKEKSQFPLQCELLRERHEQHRLLLERLFLELSSQTTAASGQNITDQEDTTCFVQNAERNSQTTPASADSAAIPSPRGG